MGGGGGEKKKGTALLIKVSNLQLNWPSWWSARNFAAVKHRSLIPGFLECVVM